MVAERVICSCNLSRDRELDVGQGISRGKDQDFVEAMPCFRFGEVEVDLLKDSKTVWGSSEYNLVIWAIL